MAPELPKYLSTVMCEDVRREEFGKMSLMGVYGTVIYFRVPPMRLRSLVFYNTLLGGSGTFSVRYSIVGPDEEELVKSKEPGQSTVPHDPDSAITNLIVGFTNMEFKNEGSYNFRLYFGENQNPLVHYEFRVEVKPERFVRSYQY